jgi:hypothetical protein
VQTGPLVNALCEIAADVSQSEALTF